MPATDTATRAAVRLAQINPAAGARLEHDLAALDTAHAMPAAHAADGREMAVSTRRDGVVAFRSSLTDEQAIQCLFYVAASGNSFAADLRRAANSRGLSESQARWAHKLANDWLLKMQKSSVNSEENSANSVNSEVNQTSALFATFDNARAKGAKRMKIKLQDCILKPSQTGDDVWVLDPHNSVENRWGTMTPAYLGKVNRIHGIVGSFSDAVMAQVQAACVNPAGVAAEYGHETGNCSFCSKELTDNRSLSVGYGPVCADKFGLPWGRILSEFIIASQSRGFFNVVYLAVYYYIDAIVMYLLYRVIAFVNFSELAVIMINLLFFIFCDAADSCPLKKNRLL